MDGLFGDWHGCVRVYRLCDLCIAGVVFIYERLMKKTKLCTLVKNENGWIFENGILDVRNMSLEDTYGFDSFDEMCQFLWEAFDQPTSTKFEEIEE